MALPYEARKARDARPLTKEEARFAAERLDLLWSYIYSRNLPPAEWFDVLAIRYLQTVKRWHEEPDLWQWSFSTILWAALRSAVSNERQKQRRRPKTVSLDAPIPGTDDLRLMDVIASSY